MIGQAAKEALYGFVSRFEFIRRRLAACYGPLQGWGMAWNLVGCTEMSHDLTREQEQEMFHRMAESLSTSEPLRVYMETVPRWARQRLRKGLSAPPEYVRAYKIYLEAPAKGQS